MEIKRIFDEIAAEPSTNKKMEILAKYKDNKLLQEVFYLGKSKRVKFYLKEIPEYTLNSSETDVITLEAALEGIKLIAERKIAGGNKAIDYLRNILNCCNPDDAYIIERVITKDLKINMGSTQINKVIPGLVEKTNYMGCKPFSSDLIQKILDVDGCAYSQKKMDGRYCSAIIRDGDVYLESRQGEETIITGSKVLEELSTLADEMVFNGELTMTSEHREISRYEANGIISSIIDIQSKKDTRTEAETTKKIMAFEEEHMDFQEALDSIVFTVWDMIPVEVYYNYKTVKSDKYKNRFAELTNLINGKNLTRVDVVESFVHNTYPRLMAHFSTVLNAGFEGTVVKSGEAIWCDGKKNHQVKLKIEMDVDLKIVGFNYGAKGTKNETVISSFNAESSDGLVKTKPQGLKEDLMKYVTEHQDELLGTILECKCNGLSSDSNGNYSLLHPAFIKLRTDKTVADSLEDIKDNENMIKGLK